MTDAYPDINSGMDEIIEKAEAYDRIFECKDVGNIIAGRTKEQAEEWGFARIKDILRQDMSNAEKAESIKYIVITVLRHLDELEAENYGRAN